MARRVVAFDILANDKVSATYERIEQATKDLKRRLDAIAAKATELKIGVNDKDARAKLFDIQARLASLDKKVSNPRIDIAGLARSEAELAAIDHQLDEFGHKRKSASINIKGTKSNGRAIDEILKGLAALSPAGIPVFHALEGAAGGMATAIAGAATGLGAFGAIAASTLKNLQQNTSKLSQLQSKITTLKQQGPSSAVVRAQESLNSALANQAKVQGSTSSSSLSLQKAQLQLAHAQQIAGLSAKGSTSSSTTLEKAQLRLQKAQTDLYNATPKNRASKLYTEQQAELSLASAQSSSAKSASSNAKTQANSSYSIQRAELAVASAKASAAKSAQSSANQQAAAADRVKKAQENLALAEKDSPLNKAIQQQNQLLASMTPAERNAAKALQDLQATWENTKKKFEPLTFGDLATGMKIAKQAIGLLSPAARSAGMALGTLEKQASKALGSSYWREFFSWLSGRAGRDVSAFGKILGNLGTGFAGLLRAFDPLANDMERGLERISGRFATFGKGANSSQSFQRFIADVERTGPQVLHMFSQLGQTMGALGRALAPLGHAELTVITTLAGALEKLADTNPKLILVVGSIYAISRASKALHLANTIKNVSQFSAGLRGVEGASGKMAQKGAIVGKVLGGVGGAFGLTGLAATGMGLAVAAAAVGVGVLTYKLLTAKSANEKYYDSLLKQYHATGNNEAAYKKAADAAATLKDPKLAKAIQLSAQNAGNYGLSQAEVANTTAKATDQQKKNTYANQKAIETYKTLVKNGNAVADVTGLTRVQSENLAWSVGVDLTKKVGTSTKAQQAWQKTLLKIRDAQIANRDALLGSLNPTDRVNAATQILADKHATAAEKIQAVNAELQDETSDLTDVANASAAVGDSIANLSKNMLAHTTATGRAAAVTQILSGNLDTAGPKTRQLAEYLSQTSSAFKTEIGDLYNSTSASKGNAAAADAVARKHADVTKALEGALEKMGLTAHQAHELASRYLAIPKNITTSVSMLKAHDVEKSADTIRQKVLAIPLQHTTKTSAQISSAQRQLDVLQKQIDKLPKKPRIEAQAAIDKAQGQLDTLESHIYDLVHKHWTVTVDSKGNIHIPNPRNGPVATPFASGGFSGFGPRGVDRIPAMLAPHEYVQPASAVDREGVPAMDALRAGRATIVPMAAGGLAGAGLISIKTSTNAAAVQKGIDSIASQLALAQKFAASQPSLPTGTGDMSAHSASAAAAQAYARTLLAAFGWSAGQMGPLISLWNGESGWNNLAQNPTSTAFGIAQFLNGTWAGKRYPKTTNYKMQVYDGLQYIKGSYGSPAAAFAAWSSRSPHWYADGLSGGVFTRPTLIGVGERGPERVDVTPLKGYASGGLASTARGYSAQLNSFVTVKTSDADIARYTQSLIDKINRHFKGAQATFLVDYVRRAENDALAKEHKLRSSFGGRLITSITDSFKDPHSAASIDQAFHSIIGRLDQGLTGSTRSGIVAFTQRVNSQMDRLATARERVANRLASANELSTTVKQGAQSYADITSLTSGTPRYIQIQLRNKLASISKFSANIKTLQKRGLSRALLQQLIAAGIDQAAPIAQSLVHATSGQLHSINATERAIGRATNTLGTVAVNAQFGANAAHSFVAGLQRQEKSLERQMAQLAKVFAKEIGHTFHLKGYASGGAVTAGIPIVVGEDGPEIYVPGMTGTIIPNSRRRGGAVMVGPSADDIGKAVATYMAGVEFDLSQRGSRTVAKLAERGAIQKRRLKVAT